MLTALFPIELKLRGLIGRIPLSLPTSPANGLEEVAEVDEDAAEVEAGVDSDEVVAIVDEADTPEA